MKQKWYTCAHILGQQPEEIFTYKQQFKVKIFKQLSSGFLGLKKIQNSKKTMLIYSLISIIAVNVKINLLKLLCNCGYELPSSGAKMGVLMRSLQLKNWLKMT